jgi:hypothetical protein
MPVDGQMMPSAARNALLVNMCKYFEKDANNQRKLLIPTKQNDGYTYGNVMRMIEELSAMQIKETSETGVTSFGSVIDHDDCVFSLALALRDVTRSRAMPDHIIHTETVDRIERMTLEDGVARFIN